MIIPLFVYSLLQLSASQSCTWGDFSLAGAQGYEVSCIQGTDNSQYSYTPCMSYALCQSQRYQSVNFNRQTGACNYALSNWDNGETIPQFGYRDGVKAWTFYYTNGQSCNGGQMEMNHVWLCDETATPFSLQTRCGKIDDDECKREMIVNSSFACVEGPPPQQECKWGDFSLIGAMGYGITCTNAGFAYEYTPCDDRALCNGDYYQGVYFNQDTRQCEYYLTQWDYGLTVPEYFNNNGVAAWRFSYQNGEETATCPDGVGIDITWKCNVACQPFCLNTECSQVNECRHEMTIESVYACVTGEEGGGNVTDVDVKRNREKVMEILSNARYNASKNMGKMKVVKHEMKD